MSKKRFESVWDAIEDTAQDAAAMRARADLMLQLQEHLRKRKVSQSEAAKLLKVTQPRVSDLMRGRIDLFSTDMLIEMLGRLGARVKVSVEFRRGPLTQLRSALTEPLSQPLDAPAEHCGNLVLEALVAGRLVLSAGC